MQEVNTRRKSVRHRSSTRAEEAERRHGRQCGVRLATRTLIGLSVSHLQSFCAFDNNPQSSPDSHKVFARARHALSLRPADLRQSPRAKARILWFSPRGSARCGLRCLTVSPRRYK